MALMTDYQMKCLAAAMKRSIVHSRFFPHRQTYQWTLAHMLVFARYEPWMKKILRNAKLAASNPMFSHLEGVNIVSSLYKTLKSMSPEDIVAEAKDMSELKDTVNDMTAVLKDMEAILPKQEAMTEKIEGIEAYAKGEADELPSSKPVGPVVTGPTHPYSHMED